MKNKDDKNIQNKNAQGCNAVKQKKLILIAEDSAVSRSILVHLLAEEYEILESENGRDALEKLFQYGMKISAIILDLIMPEMDGFEFLKIVSMLEEYKNIPILVATESSDQKSEVKALEMGAWDFVAKPYHTDIIRFRLRNAIERSQLAALSQLKYLAEYDALTNIHNKKKFFETTHQMLVDNQDKDFAFVRFDIDRFHLINSFYGHQEGDRLLCYLADGLKAEQNNLLYTYGRIQADVFAFCIVYEDKDEVIKTLERIEKRIKAYNQNFDIVPIFGVYFLEDHFMKVDEILDCAALAAKSRKGKYEDTIVMYQQEMDRHLQYEQKIINEMSAALKSGQFCIYLQPKFDLESRTLSGAEALVRWNHPEKGMISPGEFVPIFEKNGFIARLDYFVWETTCELLFKWIQKGHKPYPVSVNVSRVNLYNPKLVEQIVSLTKKYDIDPKLLQLELTESAYMDNPQVMKVVVRELHEKGFTILMDDFGSGYSSLSILKDIEVDILKIDMQFLENSEIPERGRSIVTSIVKMAKGLGIPSIAEGTENVEQVDFLQSIGCECAQGYYFSKPVPVCEYEKLSGVKRRCS